MQCSGRSWKYSCFEGCFCRKTSEGLRRPFLILGIDPYFSLVSPCQIVVSILYHRLCSMSMSEEQVSLRETVFVVEIDMEVHSLIGRFTLMFCYPFEVEKCRV